MKGQRDALAAVLGVVREGLHQEERFDQKLKWHSEVSHPKTSGAEGTGL